MSMIYLIHSPLEPQLEQRLRDRFPAVFGQARPANAQVEQAVVEDNAETPEKAANDRVDNAA